MDTEEATSKDNPPQGDTANSAGIQLENTAIQEYLDIVRKEYDIEREKRQAYENRIGIILSLLSVACFFYFQYILPKDISVLFTQELTFLLLIKILSGILIYVSMMAGMVLSVVVISTKKQKAFAVDAISDAMLEEPRIDALKEQFRAYKEIVISRRNDNKKRGDKYQWILISILVMLISTLIYTSI